MVMVERDVVSASRSSRATRELVRESSRLKVLNRFAIDLIAIPSEFDLFWYVAREVVGKLGFVDCVVYLVDPERRLLRQVAAIGEKNPSAETIVNVLEIPIGDGITGHVAKTREPMIVDDLSTDARYIPDLVPARSEICVPLIIGDELIGVIDSEDPRPRRFSAEDLEVLSAVAAMTCAKLSLLRQEEALLASQARARANLEAVTVPVIVTRWADGKVLYVDPAVETATGLPPDRMISLTGSEYWMNKVERGEFLRLLEETGVVSGKEIRTRRSGDGSLRWTSVSSRRIKFDYEDAILTTFQDVTERHEAEAARRISEERLQEAAKLAHLGHWEWDVIADRCSFCSDEAARIHGLAPQEYIDRASAIDGEFSLVHADDRDRVQEIFASLRNGHEIDLEYRIVTPAGEVKYAREMARPIRDGEGRVVRERGTILDITALKRSEERLRQAQRLEAVGKLTGGIAHDFNNLLAVVHGNAELLERSADETDRTLLDPILRAARRGSELTQRLLAFSRRQPLHSAPTDVTALVSNMRELLSRTLAETIRREIDGDGTDLWGMADPGQMENALLNLAINARQAMAHRGTLRMETSRATLDDGFCKRHPEARPGRYVKVSVHDDGTGIAPDILDHVFEPFFTTKKAGEGSGLGLSMVYGFAQQSDGFLAIDSTLGKGTSVHLYVPRCEAAAHRGEDESRDEAVGGAQRILVVEDDRDVRVATVKILENLGYRVVGVESGEAALSKMAEDGAFDVMLSDVVMAGMSGVVLAREARNRQPGLKVLLMSGYADSHLEDHDLPRDVDFLGKPFKTSDLSAKVRAAIQA